MSEIRDKLELELDKYEYKTDIESIKQKESYRKRKCRNIAVMLSSVVIVFAVALSVLFLSNSDTSVSNNVASTITNPSNNHSFFIVASALDNETGEPVGTTVDNAEMPDEDMIMINSMLECMYYVSGDEKYNGTYLLDDERLEEIFAQENLTVIKAFNEVGQRTLWIEGQDIIKVEYEVENGKLSKWTDFRAANNKSITLVDEEVYNEDKVIEWTPTEELLIWIEELNTHNGPVDFSTAPKDEITITATFSDGNVATRELKLYYNDYGYLVVETEDGTKYNDGKLNDYEEWYKHVYEYDKNGNPIKWDYSGRKQNN